MTMNKERRPRRARSNASARTEPPAATVEAQDPDRGRSRRYSPEIVIGAIVRDAIRSVDSAGTELCAVGPAEPGDPTFLFVRRAGQTCLMLGVPPEVIRSSRLRGEPGARRRHDAAETFELMRVGDVPDPIFGPDDDMDEDEFRI